MIDVIINAVVATIISHFRSVKKKYVAVRKTNLNIVNAIIIIANFITSCKLIIDRSQITPNTISACNIRDVIIFMMLSISDC